MKPEIITLANKVLHDLNFDKTRTTTQIVAEAISNYAEQQVKLCNKPAVSKCNGVEREAAVCSRSEDSNPYDLSDKKRFRINKK